MKLLLGRFSARSPGACFERGPMVGPFDIDAFLQRMATLDRNEIIVATRTEIRRYDEMQRRTKGAMRAATREHRQRLAAFLEEVLKRER
jgi:hypothetical protein